MTNSITPWAKISPDYCSMILEMIEPQCGLPSQENLYAYAFVLLNAADDNIMFLERSNCFKVFSPKTGNWVPVSERQMIRMMQDAVFIINERLENNEKATLVKHTDSPRLKKILEELRIIMCDGSDELKRKFGIIHAANGFLEPVDSGGLLKWKFTPNEDGQSFYFTRSFRVEFKQEASCPRWLAFLQENGLNTSDQCLLQNYFGQIILGQGNRAQLILLIDGAAGTGKSTMSRVLIDFIGAESVAVLHGESFGSRFDLARYKDKLCLLGMDVPRDVLLKKGSTLKAITGGDFLQGALHGSDREVGFEGNMSIILMSNDRLRLNLGGPNDVSAFRRRLASITFSRAENTQVVNSPSLFNELKAEASGIFNWMLEGALRVYEHGGSIELTPEQKHRVEEILEEAKPGETFVDACVVEGEENDSLTVLELFDAFERFCIGKGWDSLSARNAFSEIKATIIRKFHKHERHDIMRMNGDTGKETRHRGFRGLRIKQ